MPWIVGLFVAVAVLCVLLLLANEAGFRTGCLARQRDGDTAAQGLGVIEGAVFSLLGLLIAFTFSSAGARLDHRRALIADEANAISTSYLRLDLLGPELSAPIRPLYRDYLEMRIAALTQGDVDPAKPGSQAELEAQQARIWSAVIVALERNGQPALAMPVLGALGDMFDVTTTRRMAAIAHPPAIVYGALALVAILATFLAGHARGISGRRSLLHTVVFVFAISGTFYSTMEIEFPRLGLVVIEDADVVLTDLREAMR